MMQIAEEDTHQDYVVCQGYDPRVNRWFDAVSVAKPYGKRTEHIYRIGQVYPAVLPLLQLTDTPGPSQNSGVAESVQGQPDDLDEPLEILYDDDSTAIDWLLLDGGHALRWFQATESANAGSLSYEVEDDEENAFTVYPSESGDNWGVFRVGEPNIGLGFTATTGWAMWSATARQWQIAQCNALTTMPAMLQYDLPLNDHKPASLYWLVRDDPLSYTYTASPFPGEAVNAYWPCTIPANTMVVLNYVRQDNLWLVTGVDPSAGKQLVTAVDNVDPEQDVTFHVPCWSTITT